MEIPSPPAGPKRPATPFLTENTMAAKTANSDNADAATAGKKGETITVVGPVDGRWRAGKNFGPTAIDVDLSTITVAQLAAIEGNPLLSVKRS